MSAATSRIHRPKAPARPRVRLDSLKPQRRDTPTRESRPPITRQTPVSTSQCPNPSCSQSDVIDEDGKILCTGCGWIINDVQITQDLQFGEAANGAAVVQGTYVGANDETARNSGLGSSKLAGGVDPRVITTKTAHSYISSFITNLRLTTTHKERAQRVFSLALLHNFCQGRTIQSVAAVCLYIACRQDTECRIMLLDLSELCEMNVWKLGQVYDTLVKTLQLRKTVDVDGGKKNVEIFDVNPENLIYRFAQDLEFGSDTNKIANEAVQILKRMKKDWIHVGRRPAGVCAAALILSARMNNYRRTVREVVYTAKVCDITIHKRLDEFKYTDSSKLTVSEFRHYGLDLEKEHDPPAYYQQFQKKKRRKLMRETHDDDNDSVADSEIGSVAPPTQNSHAQSTRKDTNNSEKMEEENTQSRPLPNDIRARSTMSPESRARADRAAMPPPAQAIDPALLDESDDERHLTALAASARRASSQDEESNTDAGNDTNNDANEDANKETTEADNGTKRKRVGRPAGTKNKRLPFLNETAIEDQSQIEAEVDTLIEDPDTLQTARDEHEQLLAKTIEGTENTMANGVDETSDLGNLAELDDDPEVSSCLLSAEEIAIKERIWVHENGQYLREKQARKIKAELAEAAGMTSVKKTRTRRRKRMGAGNWEKNEKGELDKPATAADSTVRMLKDRGYSKKINYDKIKSLYEKDSDKSRSTANSENPSRGDSESVQEEADSAATTPQPIQQKDKASYDRDIGLQTPQATAERNESTALAGADKNAPIEIEDHGTPSVYTESDEEDYMDQDEPEDQYEFGDDDDADEQQYYD